MTSAYAPFNVSYANRTPYLTVNEFKLAPTALDLSTLAPSGSVADNDQVIAETLARASGEIDTYLFGAYGTLNATANVENARVWANRDGNFVVHPKFWPILEVQAFEYGYALGQSASVQPAGNCWIEPQQFIIGPSGISGLGLGLGAIGIAPGRPAMCQWTYINGFPNTTLSASVGSGASVIALGDTTGVYPGTTLTVFDRPNDEQVEVDSSFEVGSLTVPLAWPLAYDHTAGAAVSNMPPNVKLAAILVTSSLIKQRGSGALEVADVGDLRPTGHSMQNQGADADLARAAELLDALRTTYVGY